MGGVNPRRYGSTVMYRVSGICSWNEAHEIVEKYKTKGYLARVDAYFGEYGVWAVKKPTSKCEKSRPEEKTEVHYVHYHGTSYDVVERVRKSGYVTGCWTANIDMACMFSLDSGVHAKTKPMIVVAKIPSSIKLKITGEPVGNGGRLPIKYVTGIYVYKALPIVWEDEFVSKRWVKESLPKKEDKLVTLYHGTTSDALEKALHGKYIIGWWSRSNVNGRPSGTPVTWAASRYYSYTEQERKDVTPVVIEIEAPLSLFRVDPDLRSSFIPLKRTAAGAVVDKGLIMAVWWYVGKPLGKGHPSALSSDFKRRSCNE